MPDQLTGTASGDPLATQNGPGCLKPPPALPLVTRLPDALRASLPDTVLASLPTGRVLYV